MQTALTSPPLSGGAETVARQDCQSDTCRVAVTVAALETHRLSLITQSVEQPDSQSVRQSISHLYSTDPFKLFIQPACLLLAQLIGWSCER